MALPSQAFAGQCQQPDRRVIINGNYTGISYAAGEGDSQLPVRQIFEHLGGEVFWSEENQVIVKYEGETYSPQFSIKSNRAFVDNTFVSDTTGMNIQLNEETNSLVLTNTGEGQLATQSILSTIPTFEGYTEEDLKWMSQIIHAEANGEPYEAKIAVGNVIINRMNTPQYPNSVKEVIFDKKSGVQFTPTSNGAIYNEPSVDSYMAAVEVLEGKRNAEGALFFINPRYAKSSWVSRNRPYAFTMNNHDFYY